jgi:thioesterase domain-containing protein
MLDGSTPTSSGVLVPIQPRGTRPPFFCAAPILGTVFPYYELAHLLADGQPLYGLQPLGVSAPTTVETLARRYLEAVRSVQPEGPYHLGGWSFGGLVAYEMAQQLMAGGHDVALLAIVDTPAPGSYHRLRSGDAVRFFLTTVLRGLWLYLRDYGYLAAEASARAARHEKNGETSQSSDAQRWLELVRHRLGRAAIAAIVPPESHLLLYHPPSIRQMLRALGQGLVATLRYRQRVFPGAITLLRTSQPEIRGGRSALLGWDELAAGGVTAYTVPGTHMTLFRRPHVVDLARTLQEALDRSHRRDTAPHLPGNV